MDFTAWIRSYLGMEVDPWSLGKKLSLSDFLDAYSLHDSYWIGIYFDVCYSNSVQLGFEWDPVWLPEGMVPSETKPNGTKVFYETPKLFVKLEGVSQISTSGFEPCGNLARTISNADIVEVDGKSIFEISDIYGGFVSIVTQCKSGHFLVVRENKSLIELK